jgi:hypothetical protein
MREWHESDERMGWNGWKFCVSAFYSLIFGLPFELVKFQFKLTLKTRKKARIVGFQFKQEVSTENGFSIWTELRTEGSVKRLTYQFKLHLKRELERTSLEHFLIPSLN